MDAEASSEKHTLTTPTITAHPVRKWMLPDVSSDGFRLLPDLLGSRKDGGRAHASGTLQLDVCARILGGEGRGSYRFVR